MARTPMPEIGIPEWSCPLCTLLNAPEENRCAACDNARPSAHSPQNFQHLKPSTSTTTVPEAQITYRHVAGVFFSSVPRDHNKSSVSSWKSEKRLNVNRRRGSWRQTELSSSEQRDIKEKTQNSDYAGTFREREMTSKDIGSGNNLEGIYTLDKMDESENMMDEETEADVDEPCFNLLGLAALSNDGIDQMATDKTKNGHCGEIRTKLANAGLDLSDSDDDHSVKLRRLKRRNDEKNDSLKYSWACPNCTNVNEQTWLECSRCHCKRNNDIKHNVESTEGLNMRWACHVCANVNDIDMTTCQLCHSAKENHDEASEDRWKCSLCATFNAPGTTQCYVCNRLQEDQIGMTPQNGPQCSVCTNINAPGSTRCELCDSSLPANTEVPNNHCVDLSWSPVEQESRYRHDDDELDNPYADMSRYNNFDTLNEVTDVDPDYVEDISDNEPSLSSTTSRPPVVRADLKEFEHFLCMEDVQRDYGCRINYTQMFAGQRSKKTYADRFATRQAQSRKRKRSAKIKEAGKSLKPVSQNRKAAKGGKKQKATTTPRRASVSRSKGLKVQKAKTSARRASTMPIISSSVNHYDDSSADFGEDVNTLAWEGVGSAGYL
ncbi:putative Zinc finger, RanBP2-type [Plasmopara halstedii]